MATMADTHGGHPHKKAPQHHGRHAPPPSLGRLVRDYLFAIGAAAVIAILLRVFVVEAFRIPTDFMAPMLLPGDHIFVNKLAYKGPFGADKPARGDVIVFAFSNDPTKDYIKRVVGIGGDRVEMKKGVVILNGNPVSRLMETDVFEETLDGRHYYVEWRGAPPEARDMTGVVVPQGQVFVLGDNRAKGQDSRSYGFLPVDSIKGRASWIWLSLAPKGGADRPGGSPPPAGLFGVRWSRILTKVE